MESLDYINNVVEKTNQNILKTKELIDNMGKFDKKFITHIPKTAYSKDANECLSYKVKTEVLFEKIGNKNKGVFQGVSIEYGDFKINREQYKEDNNIFNMWINGKIQGSVLITSNAGFTINALNNEIFFGCNYDYIHSNEQWKKLTENL